MPQKFQLVVDCADPDREARFWADALHYELQSPPEGWASWSDYWRSVGVPEDELEDGHDCIVPAAGEVGPRLWFQKVPEAKSVKNRLHIDISVSGGRSFPIQVRKQRVDAEAERLVGLGATLVRTLFESGVDHYAVAMLDPEGNEFDIN